MKTRLFISLIGLLISSACYSQITLIQCYELVRNNYPLIKQFGLIEQTQNYNLSNASKNWFPQVSINARATYQSDVTELPFDSEKLSVIMPGFSYIPISKDQYQLSAEINQTIWDGGFISSSKSLARAQAKADKAEIENELYTLNGRVNQLYFGCLLQNELLKQNTILQNELNTNIDRISAMINNGLANQSDKESLEVELLNAKQREIELKSMQKAYLIMLGALTGKSLENSTLSMPAFPGEKQIFSNINRYELKLMDAKDYLLNTQYKMINSGLMPRIGLFIQGGYGRPGLNMLSNSFELFYMAGIRVSWNFGKFYTLKDDKRKIDTGRKSIEVQRETFLFNVSLQLLEQNTEIQKINELLKTDQDIVNLRTNIKQSAEAKLTNGVISISDLIREINAENMAKQNMATRRIIRLMTVYNYMYVQGF